MNESSPLVVHALAKNRSARILLVEGWDSRVKAAAESLREIGFTNVVTFNDSSKAAVPEPTRKIISSLLLARRQEKGLTPSEAERLSGTPLFAAAGLLACNEVDVVVSGAVHATAEVIRSGLWILDKASPSSIISSSFLLELPQGRRITFGDCGVVPAPNAEQLAEIAAASAQTHERLVGETPAVAFLSFSTLGSAEHERITFVREAVEIFRSRYPHINADGELQFDAAWIPEVAARKAPNSPVAGRANVFIFPSLEAANIGYKIAERLGGATAIGPLLQGFSRPFLDLSRGCSANDIVLSSCCGVLLS